MNNRKWLTLIILVALLATAGIPGCASSQPGVAGGQSIGDPYIPELGNTGYDVQHYTLRFTIDPDQYFINGRATIEAKSTLNHLSQISLDFTGYDISKLEVDGKLAKYVRQAEKLIVNLPRQRDSGQAFSLDVTYSGMPPKKISRYIAWGAYSPEFDHLGVIQRPDRHAIFTVSMPDGAHAWYPSNDHPRDKATSTIELTVPQGMQGIANGVLSNTQKGISKAFADGRSGDRYTWEMKQPMSTYQAVIVVGPYTLIEYESLNGVKLRSYVYPEMEQFFHNKTTTVVNLALNEFARQLGSYPYDEFGYATAMDNFGGSGTQSMALLESDTTSVIYDYFLYSGLLAQWFGNYVGVDTWADFWRDQGLNAYFCALYGDQYFVYHNMDVIDANMLEWGTIPSYPLNNPPPEELLSSKTFFASGVFIHELHKTMGDEAFFKGIKAYLQKYGNSTASQEQFKAELEKAYGKPLDSVFDKWLASQNSK